jgi:hypothetical protein
MNQQAIIDTAVLLDKLFTKYKSESSDISAAYQQCKSLIERAKAGEFIGMTAERLPSAYFSTEFDLIGYRDLYKAASDLNMYLEGWDSEEAFNTHMDELLGKNAEQ